MGLCFPSSYRTLKGASAEAYQISTSGLSPQGAPSAGPAETASGTTRCSQQNMWETLLTQQTETDETADTETAETAAWTAAAAWPHACHPA